jgi:ribosome-binding protein aMBF1 (putative translation factor)
MKKITKSRIPIVKSSRKPPKEDGWTAQDIREAVEEMHFAESVGEALQTARQTRQLTGASLGKRLGIGRSRVSQLEHKSYNYDLATLYRVLDALDYDLELALIPRKGGKAIVVGRG